MTYPVARIRSTIPRTLRRFALWVGLDRSMARGSVEVVDEVGAPLIDDILSVMPKEPMG